jgi:hypothetical protein
MKGYPKHVATKQDFINLLSLPECKEQALADLQAVHDLQDDTMERVVSYDMDEAGQMTNVVTETVSAPMPKWKRMGFSSRQDILDIIRADTNSRNE